MKNLKYKFNTAKDNIFINEINLNFLKKALLNKF
jgi:hypothetical protein